MPRWPGGLIRKTPVTPTGPLQNGAASGVWTLADAAYWVKQGLWPIAGNFLAVEDVFSTYLYTGNGSTQTITNGIDLAGKGGLWWAKGRSNPGDLGGHGLVDTARGAGKMLQSNTTGAQFSTTGGEFVTSFNSNGVTIGNDNTFNRSGELTVGWTFRKAPKFFDVVTYTGNSISGGPTRTLSHNLGVAPGMVIIKCTTTGYAWVAWHRSVAGNGYLNSTAAFADDGYGITVTSTTVSFAAGSGATNANGDQYVMYLFAHDAAADGIIQCGSFTTDGTAEANATVELGWEPQWLLVKRASGTGFWNMFDTMRGWSQSADARLYANTADGESNALRGHPTATGFKFDNEYASSTYIYIAIRRGPMKTPTVGTSVFSVNAGVNNTAEDGSITTLKNDLYIYRPYRTATTAPSWLWADRLRGYPAAGAPIINSSTTDAEATRTTAPYIYGNGTAAQIFSPAAGNLVYRMARAPGFFDVVCYTGNSVAGRAINHNLGVAPEMIIVKSRSASENWPVYAAGVGASQMLDLDRTTSVFNVPWGGTPTATQFYTEATASTRTNASGTTYVAYLFASCPGVSKVGSYTGNGSSQTLNCGFTTGARFFLVKRTDSAGDWWVWDSARGITAPADPALTLNSTAAEVTSADATDPDNSGIIVNQEATCNINVNGATYIFLAVA